MGIYYTFYTEKNKVRENIMAKVAEILGANMQDSDAIVKINGIFGKKFETMVRFLPFTKVKECFELSGENDEFSEEEVETLKAFFEDIPFVIFYHDCNDECWLYSRNGQEPAHFYSYDIRFWEDTPEHIKHKILKAMKKVNVNLEKLREIF